MNSKTECEKRCGLNCRERVNFLVLPSDLQQSKSHLHILGWVLESSSSEVQVPNEEVWSQQRLTQSEGESGALVCCRKATPFILYVCIVAESQVTLKADNDSKRCVISSQAVSNLF